MQKNSTNLITTFEDIIAMQSYTLFEQKMTLLKMTLMSIMLSIGNYAFDTV